MPAAVEAPEEEIEDRGLGGVHDKWVEAILVEVSKLKDALIAPAYNAGPQDYFTYVAHLRVISARLETLQHDVSTAQRRAHLVEKMSELRLREAQARWFDRHTTRYSNAGYAAQERATLCDLETIDHRRKLIRTQDLVESIQVVAAYVKDAVYAVRAARDDIRLLLTLSRFQLVSAVDGVPE